jgi:hypothetical protein
MLAPREEQQRAHNGDQNQRQVLDVIDGHTP